ncbi:MAG: hypothetical protein EOP09_00805 [Proteobacteria bacterium]|nr:MAG: hypothetical protein EOP09_00805 [Pseudomonadota bacterium]
MNGEPLIQVPGCVSACRACKGKSAPYFETVEAKLRWSGRYLENWREFTRPVQVSHKPLYYRERILLHVEGDADCGYCFGLYQDEAVLPIPECPLHEPSYNQALERLRLYLPRGLPLRFVHSNRQQLTLVFKCAPFELDGDAWRPVFDLLAQTPWQGMTFDFNPAAGRRVFSAKTRRLIWGTDQSQVKCAGQSFTYGPVCFLQNDYTLYASAIAQSAAFLNQGTAYLDLYCGIGMSTAVIRSGRPTLAVEVSGESLRHARGQVEGAEFLQGTIENRLPQIKQFADRFESLDVFVNPSRLGVGRAVIRTFETDLNNVARVAYLSCHPRSLSEDLVEFEAVGFQVVSVWPYDFFPRTGHIEQLVLLERK